MSPQSLSDDVLLALVHEIRAQLRQSKPSTEATKAHLCSIDPAVAAFVDSVADAHKEIELLLGRVSDYASAHYLSKARPLPLVVALQCAALRYPAQEIEIDVDTSAPPVALVPVEMVRSFIELFDNAAKFSQGAPIAVSIRSEETSHASIITISDRGVGLAEEQCERAFGFLARLHSPDDFPGFGLGLAIARRICEAAGATLHLVPNTVEGVSAVIRIAQPASFDK